MCRRATLWFVLMLCAATSPPAPAQEFDGQGPIPVRNFQPIQLEFLNLPFERARTLRPWHFAIYLESAEINEIATHQGNLNGTLKFETNRTVLGGALGLAPGFEVGLDIPMISRFGGFLDPFINDVESLFGTTNPERQLFPDNHFGAFHVSRGDVVLFDGPKQQFALGDIWTSAKYELWQRPGWPLVSLRSAFKFPTGRSNAVFGSGAPDLGFGLAGEYLALRWLMLYANLNVIFPFGPITPGNLTLNPIVTEGFAFEAHVWRWFSLLLQQETYTSPIHGTGARLLDGTVVELTAGINVAYDPFLLQIGAINNVSGVEQAADFTLMLRLTFRK